MAIDYQRILMDMNRPQRRQGGGLKKLFIIFLILAILGGGGYALWHYGIAQDGWNRASAFVGGLLNRGASTDAGVDGESSALAQTSPEGAMQPPADSLRPQAQPQQRTAAPAQPVPAPNGPISVAANGSAAPSATPGNASLRPASAAPAAPQTAVVAVNPTPAQTRPTVPQTAPARTASGSNAVPAPILSDAKSQIKYVDQILSSDPAEAMRRMEDLLKTRLEPDDAAEAGYRVGYAARMLRDEAKAETSWKDTADKYPTLRGGRYSALALADTWYHLYAGDRPQTSRWDDIQVMYSRVLGMDDAPFLPENIKAGVKVNLNRINDSILFGSGPTKLARYHKVESGELLGSIASKYRVDYESIARVNGINPNRIRVGMDLKVVVGEVTIVVRKNANSDLTPTLTWFLDGRWMREYPTCVGDGNKTPAGTYNLTSKERDPSWTNPLNGQLLSNDHPDNILGSRWMAMAGMNTQGLGIHGTTVDDSIPGYTSAGCVRLLNKDVEELFSFARIGNKVTILD